MINNILNIVQQGEQELLETGTDKQDAKLEANVLLAYVLAKPKSYIFTWPEEILNQGQVAMFNTLIERRSKGEPIAYITGQKEFFSLIFKVTPDTLIPRPETELLVEKILELYIKNINNNLRILDLGTGTGAIAISLAKARSNWDITAIDNNSDTLYVAQENSKKNNTSNINFIESNWFENIDKDMKFDCIVSNPPYIDPKDKHLKNKSIRFEPLQALVSANNGLADIENILIHSVNYLKPNGYLLIEHGSDQLDAIKKIVDSIKDYKKFESVKDYAGLDRFIVCQI
eukprot:TRINITY_DN4207_c0_g1_i1.p1 TRINITY_DN4207_c0_g1~~TRINITY_DN4207_c0_g1_i1.p1  ORF type:complete len:287 (+),score=-57.31 TRINITY_DN4207_c0_g1_i1:1077-1937(+)